MFTSDSVTMTTEVTEWTTCTIIISSIACCSQKRRKKWTKKTQKYESEKINAPFDDCIK